MENLVNELEDLKMTEFSNDEALWRKFRETIEKNYVPERSIGNERPCQEKDFHDYRTTVNKNLTNILTILKILEKNLKDGVKKLDFNCEIIRKFGISTLLTIGEQREKNLWNDAVSVLTTGEILKIFCSLFECDNLTELLSGKDDDWFLEILTTLRPKLLKNTWKSNPAAVSCYNWLLREIPEPRLANLIGDALPTALIIFDDFVPENRILGLDCIQQILRHCFMRAELMENGYADVIYDALDRLSHEREVRYIIPLYSCFTSLLATMDFFNNTTNSFEWTKRDDVVATLLDNMECEINLELRHVYIMSLPQLLTNVGCAKWCERLTRVLAEYCGNHTNLQTLKATLQASETVLSMFQLRIPAHSATLYTAFLKLHLDLMETPVFDKEITQKLESCIYLLYKLTPNIGEAIMRDDRMRSVIKNSVHLACFGDTKYCD